jgi:membrane-associated protease RseP (regulator of RpoE activity)
MQALRIILVVISVTLASSLHGPAHGSTAPADAKLAQTLNQVIAMEQRVAPIARRLATGATGWCPQQIPTPGWLLGDRRLYDARLWPKVRRAYGAGEADAVFIAALDPDGPGARAGLRVGDAIVAIGGAAPQVTDTAPFARMARAHALLVATTAGAGLSITIARQSTPILLSPAPGCASEFRVEAVDTVRAEADGTTVYISAAMIRLAADDAELAVMIAHELAHNILRHRTRLDAAGIKRGLGQQFGRSARLTRATEVEADRLAVWLLADAGYGVDVAPQFWARYGKRRDKGIFSGSTHPRWRDRVTVTAAEAALLTQLRAADPRAVPPLIGNPPPLE